MENIDYEGLVKALKARRFLPEVFDTAAEAKAAALEIIGTKSVGIGGSATVRDMGLAEALQANGNEVYWHWLAAKEAKQAARDKALGADVYRCSSTALTTDGRVLTFAWPEAPAPLNCEDWTGVSAIALSNTHLAALLADGSVLATGDNSFGQCG